MPHKVNPIDFENSEGNIGAALFADCGDLIYACRNRECPVKPPGCQAASVQMAARSLRLHGFPQPGRRAGAFLDCIWGYCTGYEQGRLLGLRRHCSHLVLHLGCVRWKPTPQ